MGGLKATTKWVFIGHFVVTPPCEKVQGPLQLWQARHFVEKLRWNDGWKIEIRLKKGIGNPRHFVVKLPGPMADSLRLEPLHFVVNALGFWETCNMLWFCWSIPLVYNSIFDNPDKPKYHRFARFLFLYLTLFFSLFCAWRVYVLNAHVWSFAV